MRGENQTGLFGVLGWIFGRGSLLVIGLWILAAVLAYLYLPPLDDRVTGNISDLVPAPENLVSGPAGSVSGGESAPANDEPGSEAPDSGVPNSSSNGAGQRENEGPSGARDRGDGTRSGTGSSNSPSSGASPGRSVPESTASDGASGDAALSGVVEAPSMLVFSDPDGLSDGDLAEVERRLDRLDGPERPYRLVSAVPVPLEELGEIGGSGRREQTSLPVLLFFEDDISPTGIGTGTSEARELAARGGGSVTVEATGAVPAQNESGETIERRLPLVTIATLSAIFLILAFTYRSPVTPLVPLASIGLSAFLTLRLIAYFATTLEVRIPSQVEPVILVLLFGVGTDYALFLLSRTRQALAKGSNRLAAAQEGLSRAGPVILSSAMVLIAAFAVLAGAKLEVYRALGPGLALSLCVMTLVTLTLVPALLALFGRSAFGRSTLRPRRDRRATRRPGLVERRPKLLAGVISVSLLAVSLGVLGLRVGFDQIDALPDDAPSARGYEALSESAPSGILAPVNVIVSGGRLGSLSPTETSYRLKRLTSEMWETGGYAAVLGPGGGASLVPGVDFLAPDRSSARFVLVFYDSPYSPGALDQVRDLRERMPDLLKNAGLGGSEAGFGGQSVLSSEAREVSAADLRDLAPLVFAVAFVVLALLLRTPVAPVYLLASTALGFAATLGAATGLFQGLLGQEGVVYYVPFALFLLLIALGSDYNIFIMSAIREEARRKPLREAVTDALTATGPTINAAGLALSASFALLALIPLEDFRQIGLTVAAGILLDTFVIRTLLIPALVVIVGRRGFWPAKVRD